MDEAEVCCMCILQLAGEKRHAMLCRDGRAVCRHVFHFDCINDIRYDKCPLCAKGYSEVVELPDPEKELMEWFKMLDVENSGFFKKEMAVHSLTVLLAQPVNVLDGIVGTAMEKMNVEALTVQQFQTVYKFAKRRTSTSQGPCPQLDHAADWFEHHDPLDLGLSVDELCTLIQESCNVALDIKTLLDIERPGMAVWSKKDFMSNHIAETIRVCALNEGFHVGDWVCAEDDRQKNGHAAGKIVEINGTRITVKFPHDKITLSSQQLRAVEGWQCYCHKGGHTEIMNRDDTCAVCDHRYLFPFRVMDRIEVPGAGTTGIIVDITCFNGRTQYLVSNDDGTLHEVPAHLVSFTSPAKHVDPIPSGDFTAMLTVLASLQDS
eukprot:TRINITY_DN6564_c1_g1_i1.p1 TRINITY_DN6564_c1_g1~~TRINITY_DN6564_c1_g1_i1.p1  ORF type:complete len:377 (+),score=77.10 TRINITY_DN6564_c1_g1_i1:53-1183(+)